MKGLVSLCSIVLLLGSTVPAYGEYCFDVREPAGMLGKCQDLIQSGTTKQACCDLGGAGWTERSNGKRCESTCDDDVVPEVSEEAGPVGVMRCYRNRDPSGNLGTCTELIGQRTEEDCCRQGGRGWTTRNNGKRCADTCATIVDDGPTQFCFNIHTIRNDNGRCRNSLGRKTRLECCREGGAGWGEQESGRRCQTACEEHNEEQVAIDGGWSDWNDWQQCSVTCEEGLQLRNRRCSNPPPSNGGADCIGSDTEEELCDEGPCAIDGGWSDWNDWRPCSATCEEGHQRRFRRCNNPPPSNGGDDCIGSNTEDAVCDEGPCPINGGWGRWGRSDECSATCHNGNSIYRSQRRRCNNPPPQFGGLPCPGPSRRNVKCNELDHCPINGGWTEFSNWSPCSTTCEIGEKVRTRTCTNPPPRYGGQDCEGETEEQLVCKSQRKCPIHGHWSDWDEWDSCNSPQCGTNGQQFRSRTCDNPEPKYRGRYCVGTVVDRNDCENPCPVSGGWGEWLAWGSCSDNCIRGSFRTRSRACDNPRPQHGGQCPNRHSPAVRENGDCSNLIPCPAEEDGSGSGSGSGDMINCDDEDDCGGGGLGDSYSNSYDIYTPVDKKKNKCREFDYSFDYGDGEDCEDPEPAANPPPDDDDSSVSYPDDAVEVDEGDIEPLPVVPDESSNSYDYSEGDEIVEPVVEVVEVVEDSESGHSSSNY